MFFQNYFSICISKDAEYIGLKCMFFMKEKNFGSKGTIFYENIGENVQVFLRIPLQKCH